MTPEQLKASILQYAIQGKLVEQRPEEGTAEELYRQIQEERKRLIKEKIIKKGKRLPECDQDIDIPISWKLCKLGDCIDLLSGQDLTSDRYNANGEGIVYLTGASNIGNDGSIIINRWTTSPTSVAHKGNLLLTCKGTIGKTCILDIDEAHIARQIMAIKEILVDINYLRYFIEISIKKLQKNAKSMIPGIDRESVRGLDFPLPPMAEQHRIVAKIEEMLPLVEQYAASYKELEKLNAKFPEDMKKSILQYAIQGKLVEQRPEEGTAEELYRQIQSEKKQLMKEGKIKKEKPLAEITEAEIPFDIPDSWKWVRVGSLFNHNTGKAMNSSAKKIAKEGSIQKFITTSNVYWNRLDLTNVKEMFFSNDELERCTVTKGDLLMCEGGAYFGRTAIWDLDYDVCFQNHVHRLRYYKELDLMYFYYVFYFYRNTNMMKSKGTAMPGLSSVTLHEMVVPLPPLAEQKRIVQKINQLLPYCHQLIK